MFSSRRNKSQRKSDDNNNTRKQPPIRTSNSSGNLIERQFYGDDTESLHDKKVKRTKSFWKFGKNNSDNEILEGMSLWKHRDLVDVPERDNKNKTNVQKMNDKNNKKSERIRRDPSNDSDRTMINAKQEEEIVEKPKISRKFSERTSFKEKPTRKMSEIKPQQKPVEKIEIEPIDDQFYDDGDDGLMLRTVNRKNILKQYTNDSTGPDSGSESEMTSDDPYDCIVVDDQAQKIKRHRQYPDVHAIGKKLEKLSKSTKYNENTIEKKNVENATRNETTGSVISTFKTFGIGLDDEKITPEHHHKDNDGYYKDKRNTYYEKSQRRNARHDVERNNLEKLKYYSERESIDDFSDATENRQFLPRTKLHKTNSNNSNHENNSLMEYGETLQRRLKNAEHNLKFDEKSPLNGNMYGPWYDLWGLDASVRK